MTWRAEFKDGAEVLAFDDYETEKEATDRLQQMIDARPFFVAARWTEVTSRKYTWDRFTAEARQILGVQL